MELIILNAGDILQNFAGLNSDSIKIETKYV